MENVCYETSLFTKLIEIKKEEEKTFKKWIRICFVYMTVEMVQKINES